MILFEFHFRKQAYYKRGKEKKASKFFVDFLKNRKYNERVNE